MADNKNKIPAINNFDYLKEFQNQQLTTEQQKKYGTWADNLGKYGIADQKEKKVGLGDPSKIKEMVYGSVDANKKTAAQNAKECSNFCRSKGFNIVPLRYSVVIGKAKVLPATLGKNVKDVPLSNFSYTVEMLNTGYIYCLTKRAKSGFKGNWSGYKVTPKGFLSYFNVEKTKPAPVNVAEFACQNAGHHLAASVITIEEIPSDPASEAYLIFSHAPISDVKRAEYQKNADQFVAEGKWQKVKIGGGSNQAHCFGESQIDSAIHNKYTFGENRLKLMKSKFQQFPKAFVCMGLYDAIGITRVLNNTRNDLSFKKVKGFLDAKDKDNISNDHKLHTMLTIDGLEEALIRNFVGVKQQATQAMAQNNDAGIAALELELEKAKKNNNYVLVDYYEKKIKEKQHTWSQDKVKLDDYYKKLGIQKGSEAWKNNYSQLLDMDAYRNFKNTYEVNSAESEKIALNYANDHIAWLKSKYLRDALYVFDTQTLVPFGFYYHVLVSDLMKGMSGNKTSYDFLTQWLNKDKVEPENLYLKAYCFNIKDFENKFDEAMREGKMSNWENSLSIGKGLIGAFTSADAAWDNWVKNPALQSALPDLQRTSTGFAFHWLSESMKYVIDRTPKVSIAGKYPIEFARWLFILRAKTGVLAEKFGVNAYFYRIDYKIWKASNNINLSPHSQTTAKQWLDSRLKDAIDDLSTRTNSSSNRIAAIVTFFEFLNFLLQREKARDEGKTDFEFVSQYIAATMSLLGASLDMTGSWFQDSRFNVTGGLKAAGAVFATVGGALGAYLDGQSFPKEKVPLFKTTIAFKVISGITASVAGAFIAFGYTMKVIGKFASSTIISTLANKIILGKLFQVALITVGRANLIGLGLSVAEVFIRKFFFDNALEKWCKQCAFRSKKNNSETPFKDMMAESKAFEAAIHTNLG